MISPPCVGGEPARGAQGRPACTIMTDIDEVPLTVSLLGDEA
jgi:hypothetical protein